MGIVSVKTGEAAKLAYPIDLETIRFVDEKLTERAMQFIAGRMGEKNPIFLYMGTSGASGNPWIGSGEISPEPDLNMPSRSRYVGLANENHGS